MDHDTPAAIGPFDVSGRLGQGGMGVVYEARHRGTGQRVALKTVRVPRSVLVASMRREIRALARLSHPGIVAIVEEGVDRGVPWYAMELIEGRTLRDVMQERRGAEARASTAALGGGSPWWTTAFGEPAPDDGAGRVMEGGDVDLPEAVRLVRSLCEPLSYLHGEGIVHRDLKPENILVRPDGSPALLDLGAAATFSTMGERETLQRAGDVTGTVLYMSPEQTTGHLVDARSDLYALGCILHELLTGRPPFTGSMQEVIWKHRQETPLPPSAHAAGVPAALDELVVGLLSKDPRQRPGHALAVAAALRPFDGAADDDGVAPTLQRRRSAYLYRPSLRGRAEVTTALDRHLDEVVSSGGRLVALSGDEGMGRTMTAMGLSQAATKRGLDVRLCACRGSGSQGASLLPQMLEPIVDACREGGAATTKRLLSAHGGVLATLCPEILDLPGLEHIRAPGEAGTQRLLQAVRDVFRAFGRAPRVWLVDDAHLLDDASLEMLLHLVRSEALTDLPCLVVVTCLPPRDAPLLTRLLSRAAEVIELTPLPSEDLREIASEMLALPHPGSPLAGVLADRASGNPSLLAAHLRFAVDEGLLAQRIDGAWVAQAEDWARALPGSAGELVVRKVGRLPPDVRRMAEVAAVIGRRIEARTVARVADVGEEVGLDAMEALRREGLVEPSDESHFEFVNGIAPGVIEEAAEPARLRALHRAVAREIEAAADRERRLAELGRHHVAAGELDLARPVLREAARRVHRQASSAAESLLRQYVTLVEPGSRAEVEARLWLGESIQTSDPKAAADELERAAQAAAHVDAGALEARTLASLGYVLEMLGRPEARETTERAVARARETGATKVLARALTQRGYLIAKSDPGAALAVFEEALTVAGSEHASERTTALTAIARTAYNCGDVPKARRYLVEVAEIHERTGDVLAKAVVQGNLAGILMTEQRLGEARTHLGAAMEGYVAAGSLEGQAAMLSNLGGLCVEQGLPEEGARHLDACVRIARRLGNPHVLLQGLHNLGCLFAESGDQDGAESALREALELSCAIPDRRYEGLVRCSQSEVRLDFGDPAGALESFPAALAAATEVGDVVAEAKIRIGIASASRKLHDLDRARSSAAEALALARRSDPGHELMAIVELGFIDLASGGTGSEHLRSAQELAREKKLEWASTRERIEGLARAVQERLRDP